MVVALILASCKAPVVEEKEVKGVVTEPEKKAEEVEEVEEKVGPQYGGTLTYLSFRADRAPKNWDTQGYPSVFWPNFNWCSLYQSFLILGGVEEYGPRGTNEFDFSIQETIPEMFMVPDLALSWEVSPEKIVYHLREGVTWVGNPNIGMDPRELTADDVVFSFKRVMESPVHGPYLYFVDNVYAEDKYTVVFETNTFHYNWAFQVGYSYGIYPPEVVKAGASDWKNQVSSGPFILTDYVTGSQVTYERNPYFYLKTTINGKEYETPFVDKLILPLIPEESTRIAALRTGKVDWARNIPYKYKDTLATTSPDLLKRSFLATHGVILDFACFKGKFTDKNLRRAMAIGTDRKAIVEAVFEEGEIHAMFGPGTPVFTPLEELPDSARLLYEYNPKMAREMIGPGFDMEMYIDPSRLEIADTAALLVDQWAKIGVNVTLVPVESVAFEQLRMTRAFNDCLLDDEPFYFIKLGDRYGDIATNAGGWSDEYYESAYLKAAATVDPIERESLLFKDLAVYYIDNCPAIELGLGYIYNYWWPWLKNYYGESFCGFLNESAMVRTAWIDQAMK